MKEADEYADRLRDASLKFDEVWVCFDGGEHPHEADARIRARDTGVKLAISTPSIELWVLLHKVDQTAPLSAKQASRACKTHQLMRDKHIIEPQKLYAEMYGSAKLRSDSLREMHKRNCSDTANPSRDFDLLIEALRTAKAETELVASRR
jgi:hypothetical protein